MQFCNVVEVSEALKVWQRLDQSSARYNSDDIAKM